MFSCAKKIPNSPRQTVEAAFSAVPMKNQRQNGIEKHSRTYNLMLSIAFGCSSVSSGGGYSPSRTITHITMKKTP